MLDLSEAFRFVEPIRNRTNPNCAPCTALLRAVQRALGLFETRF